MAQKTWLITGSSRGLGRAMAEAALQRGDNVVLSARDPGPCAELVQRFPNTAAAVALDVADPTAAAAAVRAAEEKFGGLDNLVNNAGFAVTGAIEETTREEYMRIFNTNVFGVIEVTRAALPALRRRGGGRIVNVSSIAGVTGRAGFGYYNATKFAVEGLSEALAQEVEPFGIRVIILEPGVFKTSFLKSVAPAQKRMPEYEGTAGAGRNYTPKVDLTKPGNPARAAEIVLQACDSDDPPLHLPLGADAFMRIHAKLDSFKAEISQWESFASDVT